MGAFDAPVVLVLWHRNSGFVPLQAEATYLSHSNSLRRLMPDRTLARIGFVPAVSAHGMSNPNLVHGKFEIRFL